MYLVNKKTLSFSCATALTRVPWLVPFVAHAFCMYIPIHVYIPIHTHTCIHTPALCHQVGRLWTSLADYYIRRGLFERARDVYEEGMTTVVTVHDFSLIFDALTQFEESLLAARMEQLGEEGGGGGRTRTPFCCRTTRTTWTSGGALMGWCFLVLSVWCLV